MREPPIINRQQPQQQPKQNNLAGIVIGLLAVLAVVVVIGVPVMLISSFKTAEAIRQRYNPVQERDEPPTEQQQKRELWAQQREPRKPRTRPPATARTKEQQPQLDERQVPGRVATIACVSCDEKAILIEGDWEKGTYVCSNSDATACAWGRQCGHVTGNGEMYVIDENGDWKHYGNARSAKNFETYHMQLTLRAALVYLDYKNGVTSDKSNAPRIEPGDKEL